MINKKNLWFLTLFSLILVLSVYYITMPSELLITNSSDYVKKENKKEKTKKTIKVQDGEVITALRVTADEKLEKELDSLKVILTDQNKTTEEKNKAFEKMKQLNLNKSEENKLEDKLKEEFKSKTFVKIDGDQIKVVINSKKHDKTLANKIMRSVQANYDNKMYITVEFKV